MRAELLLPRPGGVRVEAVVGGRAHAHLEPAEQRRREQPAPRREAPQPRLRVLAAQRVPPPVAQRLLAVAVVERVEEEVLRDALPLRVRLLSERPARVSGDLEHDRLAALLQPLLALAELKVGQAAQLLARRGEHAEDHDAVRGPPFHACAATRLDGVSVMDDGSRSRGVGAAHPRPARAPRHRRAAVRRPTEPGQRSERRAREARLAAPQGAGTGRPLPPRGLGRPEALRCFGGAAVALGHRRSRHGCRRRRRCCC